MKIALIPPVEHLEEFTGRSDFHLVLSHLLSYAPYYKFYRTRRLSGGYIVLDNGAHENKRGMEMRDLLALAGALRANEIVLPDTLFDARATVEGAERALSFLLGEGQTVWGLQTYPQLMIVPQGIDFDAWERCLNDLVGLLTHAYMKNPSLFMPPPVRFTIGISKDYEVWKGGIPRLLEHLAVFREWLPFDVHLLGWGRDLLMLAAIAHEYPWVRSTDSAKPFVYAIHGISLADLQSDADTGGIAPAYPGRPPRYFATPLTPEALVIARTNVQVFRNFAEGIKNEGPVAHAR